MATPYSDVIEPFLYMISDYDILSFSDSERDLLFKKIMKSACVKFNKTCTKNLFDVDDNLEQFNDDLSNDEIYIINVGMKSEWLSPKVLNTENLKNSLNTKDFNTFSPANLLKELRETKLAVDKEFKQLMIDYSYSSLNISEINT